MEEVWKMVTSDLPVLIGQIEPLTPAEYRDRRWQAARGGAYRLERLRVYSRSACAFVRLASGRNHSDVTDSFLSTGRCRPLRG